MKARPIGVTFIAGILGLVALYCLVRVTPLLVQVQGPRFGMIAVTFGLAGMVLFNAWGLWTLQRWALTMIRFVLAVNVLMVGFNLLMGTASPYLLFEAAFTVGVLVYTLDDGVEQAFKPVPIDR